MVVEGLQFLQGGIVENGLIKGLLRDGFEAEAPLFTSDAKLDDHLEPSDIFHVVDADASQTKVIEEVRSGRNLVVQGPPGTGKSQTITNILAAAVRDGKSVLFVAEKMAALSVVHNRMVKTGLKDTCLELHSRSANKKAFLQELAQTLAKPRLLSDNGSSYVSGDLTEWLQDKGMKHSRGAPYHPQTQGKIERRHQTLKNRILLENYFLPGDLEAQIEAFVDHYNHKRYHESLNNVTPADVYFGRDQAILEQRERIKQKTLEARRLHHSKRAA